MQTTTHSTPAESAQLILKLYELRREEKMREARNWIWTFKPNSMADVHAVIAGPDSAKLRMLMGYWDMAAALVNHGAIDAEMFNDTNGEHVYVFAKAHPFLVEMREQMPDSLRQLEKVIMNNPKSKALLEKLTKK